MTDSTKSKLNSTVSAVPQAASPLPTCYVIGAGGIGLLLAYLLEQSGVCYPTVLCREQSYHALAGNDLKVTGALPGTNESSAHLRVNLLHGFAGFAAGTPVFITAKAHDVEPLLQALKPHLQKETPVVLCQNGIGIIDRAEKMLPDQPLFRLGCWMGVVREELNWIHVAGIHKFDLSGGATQFEFIETWQKILQSAGVTTETSFNVKRAEWKKGLWNIAVNGLCSIADAPNGAILDVPELRRMSESLVDEAMQMAKLDGVTLTPEDKAGVFASLEKTRTNINATLQDLRAGRHPELEYFNGAVVEVARKHDQKAPFNETIMELVGYLDRTGVRARR